MFAYTTVGQFVFFSFHRWSALVYDSLVFLLFFCSVISIFYFLWFRHTAPFLLYRNVLSVICTWIRPSTLFWVFLSILKLFFWCWFIYYFFLFAFAFGVLSTFTHCFSPVAISEMQNCNKKNVKEKPRNDSRRLPFHAINALSGKQ